MPSSTPGGTSDRPAVRPLRFAQGRLSDRPTLHLPPPGEMLSAMQRRSFPSLTVFLVLGVAGLAACERRGGCTGANCGTIIDAAVAEPGTLLPPSSEDVVANDIDEQLLLKVAHVMMTVYIL